MVALVLYDALLRQRALEQGPDNLNTLREEIDALDRELIKLLAERGEISGAIGRHKRERRLSIWDPTRERQMMKERARWARDHGVDEELVEGLFGLIVKTSREMQKT
jgi:chorismate mutase-like protein